MPGEWVKESENLKWLPVWYGGLDINYHANQRKQKGGKKKRVCFWVMISFIKTKSHPTQRDTVWESNRPLAPAFDEAAACNSVTREPWRNPPHPRVGLPMLIYNSTKEPRTSSKVHKARTKKKKQEHKDVFPKNPIDDSQDPIGNILEVLRGKMLHF